MPPRPSLSGACCQPSELQVRKDPFVSVKYITSEALASHQTSSGLQLCPGLSIVHEQVVLAWVWGDQAD